MKHNGHFNFRLWILLAFGICLLACQTVLAWPWLSSPYGGIYGITNLVSRTTNTVFNSRTNRVHANSGVQFSTNSAASYTLKGGSSAALSCDSDFIPNIPHVDETRYFTNLDPFSTGYPTPGSIHYLSVTGTVLINFGNGSSGYSTNVLNETISQFYQNVDVYNPDTGNYDHYDYYTNNYGIYQIFSMTSRLYFNNSLAGSFSSLWFGTPPFQVVGLNNYYGITVPSGKWFSFGTNTYVVAICDWSDSYYGTHAGHGVNYDVNFTNYPQPGNLYFQSKNTENTCIYDAASWEKLYRTNLVHRGE